LGGARSSSNTVWPRPRPTSIPSGILIYPTVWHNTPTSQTGQTDWTDNGPIAQGEPFYKRSPKNRDAQKKRSSHKSVESILRWEESLWWERFVKEVGFEPGMKDRVFMDGESGELRE